MKYIGLILLVITSLSSCKTREEREYIEMLNICRQVYGPEASVFKREDSTPRWLCVIEDKPLRISK